MNVLRIIELLLFHCWKIGRLFGIAIRIHWSFWVLPIAFGFIASPYGIVNSALVMLLIIVFYAIGVLLHEYGHVLSARAFGVKTRDIILTPIGGIARMEHMPENPIEEIVVALAGPAVNVVNAIVLGAILLLSPQSPTQEMFRFHISVWADFVGLLLLFNVGMVFFNMLPAFPSDGGRVFRAFLSLFLNRLAATQVAVGLGAVVALAMAVVGILARAPQLPVIAVLFAVIGQMELWMVRRQAEMEGRIWAESYLLAPELAATMTPPEADFSGYSWDDRGKMWVEWRNGVAVRKCRTRGW